MNLTPTEKFNRWVLAPIEKLKSLPDGDGAFAALSITCGLFERYVRSSLKRDGVKADPEAFKTRSALVLNCEINAFDRFWNGYRLGMQHAFHPKSYIENKGKGDRWGWEVATAEGFNYFPEIIKIREDHFVVRIDPWKFVDFTLDLWQKNPNLMNELSEYVLGDISPMPPPEPKGSITSSVDYSTEYRTYKEREHWEKQ